MMQRDLEQARKQWIDEAKTDVEKEARQKSDFLKYQDHNGLFADFHSNRHLFITSLERAGLSPKMAQTLARHSDVRLTLGIYTHVALHDQTAEIGSLQAPPMIRNDSPSEAAALRPTGTHGPEQQTALAKMSLPEVPTVVPRGAENGAILVASRRRRLASSCTDDGDKRDQISGPRIAVNPNGTRTIRTQADQSASCCTEMEGGMKPVSPTGIETLSPSCSPAIVLRQLPNRRAAKSDALDTDLRELIGAWPELPAEIRGAILVMVRAAGRR